MGERRRKATERKHRLRGEKSWRWAGNDASYFAVHLRLKRLRGAAACYDCGACGGPAKDWAYDKKSSDQRTDEVTGLEYSVDLSSYMPLCHRCHMKFDGHPAGSRQKAKTHCPKGHPYDAVNTGSNQGYRRCKTCHRERERGRRAGVQSAA